MNLTIIASLIGTAAGFALAWQLQSGNITQLELDHANERISIQRAARATIERTATAVIQAQNAAAGRVAVLRRESDSVRTAASWLRQSSDAAVRAATESTEACHRVVNAYSVVFTESTGFIQEVVGDVGRCGSAFQTLDDAWTKSNVK